MLKGEYYFERTQGENVSYSTHDIGHNGISLDEQYLLFKDSEAWETFVNETLHDRYKDIYEVNETEILDKVEEEAQKLDFENHIYFCAFRGEKGTGGYPIEVKDVILKDNTLKIYIFKGTPDGGTTQAFTYPYHIISFDKEDIPPNAEIKVKILKDSEDNIIWIIFLSVILVILIIIAIYRNKYE
jgi:hypothetical protein